MTHVYKSCGEIGVYSAHKAMKDSEPMFEQLKNERLTVHERDAMRTRLRLFMNAHPATSPLLVRAHAALHRFISIEARPHAHNKYAYRAVAVGCAVLIFAGAGTSYAAEYALPGDPLYAVKTNVNERIRSALATTAASQANWNTQLTTRRLEEAEALAAQGKLTSVTASALQQQVSQATANFDTNVTAMTDAQSNNSAVASVKADMQATLDAHASVIAQISQVVPSSQPALAPLLNDVREQAAQMIASSSAPTERPATGTVGMRTETDTHTSIHIHRPADLQFAEGFVPAGTTSATTSSDVLPAVIATNGSSTTSDVILQSADTGSMNTNNTSVETKKQEIESNTRTWLQTTVGITLPPVKTTIRELHNATSTDSHSSEGGDN